MEMPGGLELLGQEGEEGQEEAWRQPTGQKGNWKRSSTDLGLILVTGIEIALRLATGKKGFHFLSQHAPVLQKFHRISSVPRVGIFQHSKVGAKLHARQMRKEPRG